MGRRRRRAGVSGFARIRLASPRGRRFSIFQFLRNSQGINTLPSFHYHSHTTTTTSFTHCLKMMNRTWYLALVLAAICIYDGKNSETAAAAPAV